MPEIKPKHTPLPWHISNHAFGGADTGAKIIVRSNKAIVVCAATVHIGGVNAETNAAFIVRACNSHYELLEALRNMVRLYEPNGETDQKSPGQFYRKAIAAIAKAESCVGRGNR